MKRTLMMTTAIVILSGSLAMAAPVTGDSLGADYIAKGYDRVEVKVGPTQIKVEAIRDGMQTEVIYDAATGTALKQETEAADSDDMNRPGLFVRTEGSDFLDDDDTLDDDLTNDDDDDTGTSDDDGDDDTNDDDTGTSDDDGDDTNDNDDNDDDDTGSSDNSGDDD